MEKEQTLREEKISNLLWNSDSPLLASEIAKRNEQLNINTALATIKNLVKKNLVKVSDIIYSETLLFRRYAPVISRLDFLKGDVAHYFQKVKGDISSLAIVSTLLDSKDADLETLNKLEQLIQERKMKLEGKESF